jgi:hypothetical protein
MHVAPVDLRSLRQGGLTLRFAMLGEMAYVFAELPPTGSAGTSLETLCTQAHWGFVIDGELTFVRGDQREVIPAGRAFHVPAGGPEHRFEASMRALVAGFQPIESEAEVSDERLAARGFEFLSQDAVERATIVPAIATRKVPVGQIRAVSVRPAPTRPAKPTISPLLTEKLTSSNSPVRLSPLTSRRTSPAWW